VTPSRRAASARGSSRRNYVVFAVALLGLAVFVLARIGVTVLPFDQHHVLTQFLGMALALGALTQWR
jgi:hypothetical protein